MYTIKRHILPILERRFKNNIAISLSGARQVGKSTLCDHLFSGVKKISFDNKLLRMTALEDEIGFLNKQGTPLFIDEAQKVPSIFEAIKKKLKTKNLDMVLLFFLEVKSLNYIKVKKLWLEE